VVEGLKTDPLSGSALVAGSVEGSLAAGLGPPLVGKRTVMRFDRDGSSVPVTEDVRAYQGLALSPDGSILALDIDAARAAIWLLDLERGIQTRLTSEWNHNAPAWSPDGRRIATSASQGGVYQVILHDLDRGTSEVVFESETDQIYATSWSKDDTLLASLFPVGEPPQIWTVPLDGSPPRLTLKGSGARWGPMVSPDGRWIAYTADESGSEEIYVAAASGEGPRTRVSSDGGAFPRWSRNGTELYFFGGKRAFGTTLMAASVTEGDRSQVGRPRALFDVPRLYPGSNLGLEVDSAGGFYVIESVPDPDEVNADLVFTRGWVESLRGKLADR
jgi:Tol biopolymer transport system component